MAFRLTTDSPPAPLRQIDHERLSWYHLALGHKRLNGAAEKRNPCDLLPILRISITLSDLRPEVHKMTCEQQWILRRHREGVSHECSGVEGQGEGHGARDDCWVFLRVHHCGDWDPEVGNGSPEVCMHGGELARYFLLKVNCARKGLLLWGWCFVDLEFEKFMGGELRE